MGPEEKEVIVPMLSKVKVHHTTKQITVDLAKKQDPCSESHEGDPDLIVLRYIGGANLVSPPKSEPEQRVSPADADGSWHVTVDKTETGKLGLETETSKTGKTLAIRI